MVAVLEAHNDDAVLFAAFTCIRERATIITVVYPGAEPHRVAESVAAAAELGCAHEQWPAMEWDEIRSRVSGLRSRFDRLYGPAPHTGGHGHHNYLSEAAAVAGTERDYTSYVNCGDRVLKGSAVPFEPEWVVLKLRAMLCFRSQILFPGRSQHFLRDQREFYA